jgi:hypothetical protein
VADDATIEGMHVILFSRQAEKVRAFLGDVLGLPSVDAGEGWPIFAAPPTEIAVHPTDGGISDRGWGLPTAIVLPGGERIGLYEPHHPSPLAAPSP